MTSTQTTAASTAPAVTQKQMDELATSGTLDALTRHFSAFNTFTELLWAPNYTPTFAGLRNNPAKVILADAYDFMMSRYHDGRTCRRTA